MALTPTLVSEPFLYLFGVKNAIFCKFLDKLPAFRQASERVSFLYLQKYMMVG